MGPPGARETLSDELDSIERRVRRTLADGREAFFEGSDSYDRAVVAIIRLAALLEDERSRFGDLLAAATRRDRLGIITTRNIAAHSGYAVMDEDEFWVTTTVNIPSFIAKLRSTLDHG